MCGLPLLTCFMSARNGLCFRALYLDQHSRDQHKPLPGQQHGLSTPTHSNYESLVWKAHIFLRWKEFGADDDVIKVVFESKLGVHRIFLPGKSML
jgi:hypothetical protein